MLPDKRSTSSAAQKIGIAFIKYCLEQFLAWLIGNHQRTNGKGTQGILDGERPFGRVLAAGKWQIIRTPPALGIQIYT